MAQQTFNNTKINVEFDESTSRQQLNSGENISTLFGKIKKIFSDLKSVCFSGSYNDLSDKPTTATKDTNGLMSAEDKSKLDNADNKYALKSKYGDTSINVGRKAYSDVGEYSTAEGHNTTANGYASHAEGSNAYISNGEITFYDTRTVTISDNITVEVDSSYAYGVNSHAEGCQTLAYGTSSHAEGRQTTASGGNSHAEGVGTIASGAQSHAEGVGTIASGARCHAEGLWTIASGGSNHAEGKETTANGNNSCHAEGYQTTASGIATHAEGSSSNKVTDLITDFSWNGTTNDDIINAWNTQKFSLAHGRVSHVEGSDNLTLGHSSHAEGCCTVAIGNQSHTSGYYTKALHDNEAAYGKYNESNNSTLFSIGDGTADDARHNAFEITTTGGKLHDKDIATTENISNPNLLINPDFSINQREFKGIQYPSDSIHIYYTVDRWAVQPGQGMIVNSDGTVTIYGGCIQKIEKDVGDNVTASVGVVSGSAMANYDPQTKTFSITTDGESAVISWAKLEIGSVATPFSPPEPATELLKCKRYYQFICEDRIRAWIFNSSMVTFFVPFSEMRAAPTVSLSKKPTYANMSNTVISYNTITVNWSVISGCRLTLTDISQTPCDGVLNINASSVALDAEIY